MPANHTDRRWSAVAQSVAGGAAIAGLTFVCLQLQVNPATTTCLYLMVIVGLSLQGSFLSSAVVSLFAGGCLTYFFWPPLFSFRISDPFELVAVVVFLMTSGTITHFVTRVRKSADALR